MRGIRTVLSLLCFFTILIVVIQQSGSAAATLIDKDRDLPTFTQKHNFYDYYWLEMTDIRGKPYDELPSLDNLIVNPNPTDECEWYEKTPSTHPRFTQAHLNGITDGTYHCAPTVAAMILDYWAKTRGFAKKVGKGSLSQADYIFAIASWMDTNDYHTKIRGGDSKGHFATFNSQIEVGYRKYVEAEDKTAPTRGRKLRVTCKLTNWNLAAYKKEIDANRPVHLIITGGAGIGHSVVGFGYDNVTNEIIYRDPNDSRNTAKRMGFTNIHKAVNFNLASAKKTGVRTNSAGDITITEGSIHVSCWWYGSRSSYRS